MRDDKRKGGRGGEPDDQPSSRKRRRKRKRKSTEGLASLASKTVMDYISGAPDESASSLARPDRTRNSPVYSVAASSTTEPLSAGKQVDFKPRGIAMRVFGAWMVFLVLGLFLWLGTVDFLVLTQLFEPDQVLFFDPSGVLTGSDAGREDAELIKRKVYLVVYALALILALVYFRAVVWLLKQNPHWIVIGLFLAAGLLYSDAPQKVATNLVQLLVGLVLAIAAATHVTAAGKPVRAERFYLSCLVPFMGSQVLTLVALFISQQGMLDVLSQNIRYGGVSGNPNALGIVSVMVVWLSASLLSRGGANLSLKILIVICLLISGFCLIASGSVTSSGIALLIVIGFGWFQAFRRMSTRVRVIGGALLGIVFVVALFILLVDGALPSLGVGVIEGVGRDTSFTGRTDLWFSALGAISERPLFGWTLDSHLTVKSNPLYDIPFNHYHSGYLDLLVVGGMVLGALAIWNFQRFFRLALSVAYSGSKFNRYSFFSLSLLVLLLNVGEYSFYRPLHPGWQLYVYGFFVLALSASLQKAQTGSAAKTRLQDKSFGRRFWELSKQQAGDTGMNKRRKRRSKR